MPSIILKTNRNNLEIVAQNSKLPNLKELFSIITTFSLTTFAWIFFRSDSINFAFAYIHKILSFSLFTFPKIFPKTVLGYIFLFLIIEWYGRNESFAIEKFGTNWKKIYRIIFYYALTILILYFYGKDYQFLYFQF